MASISAISANNVQALQTLHNSPTSTVYTAALAPDGAVVVVKRTKITCSNDISRFNKEIELLGACNHERVIRLVGVIREAPTYAIVLPQYSRGSLFRLLHNSGRRLTPAAILQLSADVASAVAHVHQARSPTAESLPLRARVQHTGTSSTCRSSQYCIATSSLTIVS